MRFGLAGLGWPARFDFMFGNLFGMSSSSSSVVTTYSDAFNQKDSNNTNISTNSTLRDMLNTTLNIGSNNTPEWLGYAVAGLGLALIAALFIRK